MHRIGERKHRQLITAVENKHRMRKTLHKVRLKTSTFWKSARRAIMVSVGASRRSWMVSGRCSRVVLAVLLLLLLRPSSGLLRFWSKVALKCPLVEWARGPRRMEALTSRSEVLFYFLVVLHCAIVCNFGILYLVTTMDCFNGVNFSNLFFLTTKYDSSSIQ